MILRADRLTLVLTKRRLMKDTFAFLFALLLAPLSALHAADKPAHLFILSGQSNMDCDDLNNKEKNGVVANDLHYTQPGYDLLGRRYVRQAKALIDGQKPSDNGRPE